MHPLGLWCSVFLAKAMVLAVAVVVTAAVVATETPVGVRRFRFCCPEVGDRLLGARSSCPLGWSQMCQSSVGAPAMWAGACSQGLRKVGHLSCSHQDP